MPFLRPTLAQIIQKLREDFRRRVRESGIDVQIEDPILALLFGTFASQLERLYSEAENSIRQTLLDDLIAALGIEGRRARPAQMVLRLLLNTGTQLIEAGTKFIVDTPSRDKLTFTTDTTVAVSPAKIALAATYQKGQLQLVSGMEMPESLAESGLSLDPVQADFGKNPAIFIAVENLSPTHLSHHGVFFEFNPDAHALERAMHTETWCLAGNSGEFRARGILRPVRVNAGVRSLEWLLKERGPEPEPVREGADIAPLPEGLYGGRLFILPVVPSGRRFLCSNPKGMGNALATILGRERERFFTNKRAWLKISLPADSPDLHPSLIRISLHAVSASNAECLNETIRFSKHGCTIPVGAVAEDASFTSTWDKEPSKYLVSPLSIFGEKGTVYLPEFQPSSDPGVGRYRVRNGQIQLKPAQHQDGCVDSFANLRLWLTNGRAANQTDAGKLQVMLARSAFSGLKVINLTGTAGGTDGEAFQEARIRFMQALLSRDRIVTRADLVVAAQGLDRRILRAEVSPKLRRTDCGLQRVQFVKLWLDSAGFNDPEEEKRVLTEEVSSYLKDRFVYGTELRVETVWE